MSKKVLIVDDEPDFLSLFSLRLEANGFKVITAKNGIEALERVEKERPDAVLLDVMLPPGIDGLEVLKRIRKKDKKLPVFMISAYSTDEMFKKAEKFGSFGYIVKTGDLQKEVEHVISALNVADRYKK
ncbi:MAG: response regulator [Candidatus Omnitrophica bacterium]|nr:response regulator [Candidatus Omnitrophota bacterium]